MSKINFLKEWKLLEQCEKNSHTGLSGKQRFLELLKIIPNLPKISNILDVGGNLATANWLKTKFPQAEVTILNKSKKELGFFPNFLLADAQSFQTKKKYDLIFCGETIEHTYNPDGLLVSCLLALRPSGYFIVTTPNLACLYNRIFLLLGWTPGNYSPSLRFITGNPLINLSTVNFGKIGDHKSVFTFCGLKELLQLHGFQILFYRGFTYAQTKSLLALNSQHYYLPFKNPRLVLNNVIPHSLREGIIFVCRKNRTKAYVQKCLLPKNIWEM